MKPSHRSVNTEGTICLYFWGVNAENVWWLGSSDGVVVVRTDKQSYGHTSLPSDNSPTTFIWEARSI